MESQAIKDALNYIKSTNWSEFYRQNEAHDFSDIPEFTNAVRIINDNAEVFSFWGISVDKISHTGFYRGVSVDLWILRYGDATIEFLMSEEYEVLLRSFNYKFTQAYIDMRQSPEFYPGISTT
ncbi:MAG TPA: hypothetical protein PL173_07615 [Saprospiraceae bacterium]|nr:hypothetical protein [Saprospiraceae bacterium]